MRDELRAGLAKAAVFGVACALTIILVLAGSSWLKSRPRPWNGTAVTARYSDLYAQIFEERIVVEFRYTVSNTTDRDYTIGSEGQVRVMKRLPENKGFADDPSLTWDSKLFVPAHQASNIGFKIPYNYSEYAAFARADADDLDKLSTFVNKRLMEIDGFVLFDPATRYRIDFPNGWPNAANLAKAPPRPPAPTTGEPGCEVKMQDYRLGFVPDSCKSGRTWVRR